MDQRGATSAYRGYRLQALYTLARILEPGDSARSVFQPEGKEDLAVWDANGDLREVIQVKSYPNLTLSHLSSDGSTSFLHRAVEFLKQPDAPEIKLVSFGIIGPELRLAWDGSEPEKTRVSGKLAGSGFSASDIQAIFFGVELVTVSEAQQKDFVISLLRQHLVGIAPETACDLLFYWLYLCAEQQKRITPVALMNELSDIGRFLADRALYHSEWFTSITPLTDGAIPIEGEHLLYLKKEFAAGVQTRYEHILAVLDLRRDEKLAEIAHGFRQTQVVIVHAASGQGKTTLAYRYLRDVYPESWRFAIELVENRQHATRIAATLAGYANAIQTPMSIYVDVSPRDVEWHELVKRLARNPYLQILVTIREEDFARANLSGADFDFVEIALTFDEAEARQIYTAAIAVTPQVRFLDFDEAWDTFGGSGPLLEFVYLLTQTTTLRERLNQQVNRLRDEVRFGVDPGEIHLLRLVSVASAYGARLKMPKLVAALHLPEPSRVFQILEREFLIRVSKDGQLVEGLHPVRSRILTDLLTAPVDVITWLTVTREVLSLMMEEDIESFLLNACVARPGERSELSIVIQGIQLQTWCGFAGIFRVLLWLGVNDYIETNTTLVEDAFKEFGAGWEFFLDLDLAGIMGHALDNWWRTLGELFPPTRQAKIKHFRERQTPKAAALQSAMNWLSRITIPPKPPISNVDWSSFAELCFWHGYWDIAPQIDQWLSDTELARAATTLTLDLLGDLSVALYTRNSKHHAEWLQTHRPVVEARLAAERGVIFLEEKARTLITHFVPLHLRSSSESSITDAPARKHTDPLHEETVELIGLIRRLIPGYEAYGSRGHGYRLGSLQSPLDDSTIKEGIPLRLLPIRWPTYIDSIARGLGSNKFRPETWNKYIEQVLQMRDLVLANFGQLMRGIVRYSQRRNPLDIINRCLDSILWDKCFDKLNRPPALPKCAVDPWGFVSEASTKRILQASELQGHVPKSLVLQKYRPFLEAERDFIRDLYNFFFQAPHVMLTNFHVGKLPSWLPQRNAGITALKEQGIHTDWAHLTTMNFASAKKRLSPYQSTFRQLFANRVDREKLAVLEAQEQSLISTTWQLWYYYANNPGQEWADPIKQIPQKFALAGREIETRLLHAITNAGVRVPRVSILQGIGTWAGEPTQWLRLDIDDPKELYKQVEELVLVMRRGFGLTTVQKTCSIGG